MNKRIQRTLDAIRTSDVLVTTCPPVVAEFCFSAKDSAQLQDFQARMHMLYLLESEELTPTLELVQKALWAQGLVRGAGALDTLTATYAIAAKQILVTCDKDHVHIARALEKYATRVRLRVIYVAESGELTYAG